MAYPIAHQDCNSKESVGIVVIGRNEGERLQSCLRSIEHFAERIVYVDSGSSDGSVEFSRANGVMVVELDLHFPFTAARARNAGFKRLIEFVPRLEYVFFVDGDCDVVAGWIETGTSFLDGRSDVAVVFGLRREKYPEKSIYNMLCDIEWGNYRVGETRFCGGDALIRVNAFKQITGYREDLICGEEPEMCVRLRQAGWRIWHLAEPMTVHDAAILRFSQWWKRMLRGGYAFAQAAALHGAPPECHGVLESRRAWIWGLAIPLVVIIATFSFGPWGSLLLIVYPFQIFRLSLRGNRSPAQNWWLAVALVVSKFPEMLGQLRYKIDRYRRAKSSLIEYK